jgi:hypothetical protein
MSPRREEEGGEREKRKGPRGGVEMLMEFERLADGRM